ncbi:MAG TPA: 4-(cytidine 5'-diphospho)-2-C-methyl-D-erythritol kinase [Verrucomicrobiae bacterium]|nr:4-(cytidine 5'-diphospho)-2-C-methyl-D-erythritol kinase [Verrucomicrobiae bacterium]
MKQSVRVPAFAKINLCLHVIGRRPDGYHELRTIFQAISLHDTLELRRTKSSQVTLEIEGAELSAGRDNLVHRAIEAIGGKLDFRGGIHARLVKRIPIARGLGGGSSDAAAAMIAMLRLTGAKLPLSELMEVASGLGADVPFFLFGGRALAVNRGDEIYPLPDAPRRTILVVSPKETGVSTKEAYQWVSEELTKRTEPPKIWGFCALCWSRQGAGVSNDFEGPVFRRHPRLGEIRAGLLQGGAADAALAGSGSAVFGVFRNPARARRTARKFPEDSVFAVQTLSRKEYARALGWRAGG